MSQGLTVALAMYRMTRDIKYIEDLRELMPAVYSFMSRKKMKKTVLLVFLLIAFHCCALYADNPPGDIPVGRVEFISSSRGEVVIYAESDSALATASGANVLFTLVGKNRIEFKVLKTEGRMIRCSFVREKGGKLFFTEGAAVFYSDKDNADVRYGDVKVLLWRQIRLQEDFILKVESTDDPLIIAAAVNKLAEGLNDLNSETLRLDRKYPELRNFISSPPAELKCEAELLLEIRPRMDDALYKVKIFSSHPEVERSLQNLNQVAGNREGN